MQERVEKHFKNLQEHTKTLLKEVSGLSSSTYHYKPENGKWSISQILTHVVIAEKMSLDYMRKKAKGIDQVSNTGLLEMIKMWLLKASLRLPLRFKAPKIVLQNTPPPMSFGDMVRQWESVRADLLDFLTQMKPEHINRKIYKHPVAGRLNVIHAIQFFEEHMNHHKSQIRSIIAEVKASALKKAQE